MRSAPEPRPHRDWPVAAPIGALIALLVVNAFVSYRNLSDLHTESTRLSHHHDVLRALAVLQGEIDRADGLHRAYIAAESDFALSELRTAVEQLEPLLGEIDALLVDDPAGGTAIPAVRERIDEVQSVLDAAGRKRELEGDESARKTVRDGLCGPALEEARARVARKSSEELRLLAIREPASRQAYVLAITNVIVFVVIGLAVIALSVWLLRRHLRERSEAAAKIAEQAERMRATLSSIGDGVIMTDAQGHLVDMNAVAESLTGCCAEESRGQPFDSIVELIDEHTGELVVGGAARVLAEGLRTGSSGGVLLRSRAGTRRYVDGSAAQIRDADGRVHGNVLVLRDMTELRAAELERRESERQFQQLAEAMPQMVWVTGPDGLTEYFNDRWYDYVGGAPEDSLGERWMRALHRDDRERARHVWQASVSTGHAYEIEYRLIAEDGSSRWFLARALPVRDDGDRIVKWFGTCTDIEALRTAQEQHRRLAAELREADRRKDEFLGMLAHELRGPLAPLQNGLHLLAQARDPAERETHRGMMARQLRQLVRLVDDLMDIGRISGGKVKLRRQTIALRDVLDAAVETVRPALQAAEHELDVDLPEVAIMLDADPERLAQVFSNLLGNAAKYTDTGGRIALSASVEGEQVTVRVDDNGIGIPSDRLESVFELFTQLDTAPDKAHGGLGIGLNLARRFVEKHGGTIEAHSPGPGLGSTFVVRLPVIEASASAQAPSPRSEPSSKTTRRVLVVDDNRDNADSLSALMEALGHEVRTAYDGPSALAMAEEYHPDTVLLDIGLPGLDGYQVCEKLRAEPWARAAIVVALTGWGQPADRARSRDAGFDHHLVKPLDLAELERILAAASKA